MVAQGIAIMFECVCVLLLQEHKQGGTWTGHFCSVWFVHK